MKIKVFTGHYIGDYNSPQRRFVDVDAEINSFLETNPVTFVDVKFSVATDSAGESWNHALLIYKEDI